jgi:hypothetical protein
MHTPAEHAAPVALSPAAFGFTTRDYELALRAIPTADLVAEVEAGQWQVAEHEAAGESFAVALLQLEAMTGELARRQRIASSSSHAPTWPPRERDLRQRIDTVKARWPIERFCEYLLGARLLRHAGDKLKACCPLPGHHEKTPSFIVYPAENRAWCYGCNRGGDVIKLTQFTFNYSRFLDALDRLEQEGGVV